MSGSLETSINVTGYNAGIYIVRIGTPDYQRVARVAVE
jgi:hypothetical protein